MTNPEQIDSEERLRNMGISALAYIRPLEKDGNRYYAVFLADGYPLSVFDNVDSAYLAISQSGLSLSLIH